MLVQIHNDICEMTYKMSATMAEKLINESQNNPSHIIFNSSSKTQLTNASLPSNSAHTALNKNLNSELESVLSNRHNDQSEVNAPIYTTTTNSSVKKISNGIKCLPSLPPKQSEHINHSKSDTTTEFRLTNNSKSKRPISSQLNPDTISSPQTNTSTSSNQQPTTPCRNRYGFLPIKTTTDLHNKSMSSSNENLCASDEDITKESDPSSRDKTPDSFHNELENVLSAKHKKELPPLPPVLQPDISNDLAMTSLVAEAPEISFRQFNNNPKPSDNIETTPVPAPRKAIKPSFIDKFLPSRNNSPAVQKHTDSPSQNLLRHQNTTPSSPNMARKVAPIFQPTPDLKLDSIEDSDVSRLQHINKSRPKRQNVRRPTKNGQVKADASVDFAADDDANLEVTPSISSLKESIMEASNEEVVEVKKVSPVTPMATRSNDITKAVEQPLVRYNAACFVFLLDL